MRRAGLLALAPLAACSLEPHYVRPIPAVPASWPVGSPILRADEANLASLGWRQVFADPRLQAIIARALANNQDVRAAVANIEAARGLYRVQRATLLPPIDASAGVTRRDSGNGSNFNNSGTGTGTGTDTGSNTSRSGATTSYTANVGTTAFEIDLFGRIGSLSHAALDEYFATEAAARAVRLTLVADTADAWLTLATDRSLLAVANDTAANAQRAVALTRARLDGGIAPRTDLRQAETVLATALADRANLTAVVEQDRNALVLLVGGPIADAELPPSIESVDSTILPLAPGLASDVLLRRPDVVEAEFRLRAASARIGAARAAFFPRIALTAVAGLASTALSSLFSGGAFSYTVAPSATLPIFDWGANRGNLANARALAEAAEAAYQKAIQTAFRDVADALARRATVGDQFAAQVRLEAAARDTATLTDARYKGGVASFLESLDAQRTLYSARRALASTRLIGAQNSVTLYRTIGGDPFADASAPVR